MANPKRRKRVRKAKEPLKSKKHTGSPRQRLRAHRNYHKAQPEKHAGGRPSKYKPECENQALILAEKGFTDADMAEVFGVTEQTLNNWKKKFPQFFESLKKGKKIADQKVVQSLYQRALGYSHPDVHISSYEGDITVTNIIKHYPPDTAACFIWLKNRDPENWKDKHEHELTGKDGKPIPVQIVDFGKIK